MRQAWRCAVVVMVLMACMGMAHGYMVRSAVPLEEMTGEADIIFKGTALSSAPVQDEGLKPVPEFIVLETQFKVISVIKGDALPDKLVFRHYDSAPEPQGIRYMPQNYHFEVGKTYIVFARKNEAGGFRQLWPNHTTKKDQGVLQCADAKPTAGKTVKAVLWAELTVMLKSPTEGDVTYAIQHLDEMSAGTVIWNGLSDFDRKDVVAAVRGMLTSPSTKIAEAALAVVGSHNPYISEERALCWLATVGSGDMPGLGKMDPKMKNTGGETCWKDLVALADGKAPTQTRALAIRALGLVREPALREPIERWLKDREPAVRASAALLLADFPGPETAKALTALAGDPVVEVRLCTARAIGFGQYVDRVDVLTKLLNDADETVRRSAAMSLVSFSVKAEPVARVFRANLDNEEFKPLFLIALAQVIEDKVEPKNFWGGQLPAFTAWEILFKYLQAQPAAVVRSGKLDRYLDAMEKVGNYSSSEPRDIYAFYVQRGMTERAKTFREAAKKKATYDIDHYFKDVDENPGLYKRE